MNKKMDCLFVAFSGLEQSPAQKLIDEEGCTVKLRPFFNGAIAYLGSFMHARGLRFDYVHSCEEQIELLGQKLSQDVKIVAVSTTFVMDVNRITSLVKWIRQKNPNCEIVIGGSFITYTIHQYGSLEREVLMRGIGAEYFICSYFGETALAQLVTAKKENNHAAVEKIPNLFRREGNHYLISHWENDSTCLRDNMVDWTLFANDDATYIPVRTAISCMYKCSYCSFPQYGGKYQVVDIPSIEKELQTLVKVKKVEIVHFIDDCFNKPVNRFKDILRMLIRNRFPFKWHSFLRCEDIDNETIALMKESGCLGVLIGLESGCSEMLRRMNKKIDLIQSKETIRKLNEAGILTYALFMIGFPGETIQSVKRTIDYIEECKPMYYGLSPWYCNISSPVYKQKEKYEISGRNYEWKHKTMDFDMARNLCIDIFYNVKNSTMMSINYTYVFQLLYNNVPFEHVQRIIERGNQKLICNHQFDQRRKHYIQ